MTPSTCTMAIAPGEVRRVKQHLNDAYERARAGRYSPDRPEMRALGRAEQNYQQLKEAADDDMPAEADPSDP